MEHLIQLSIALDDERIQNQFEEAAVREVTKRFDSAVIRASLKQRGWARGYDNFEDAVADYLHNTLEAFAQDHAAEIISAAGKALADRLCRTKKARELLEGVKL